MTSPHRLWASGDPSSLFGVAPQTPAPWRRAPRRKDDRFPYDRAAVARLLDGPPLLHEVDPRTLYASQPWVLRHHVEYYLTSTWETTGQPSADMDQIANQYPLVHVDANGGLTILAGHHRKAAALIEGRPVLARIAVAEGAELPVSCPVTTGVAVVPRLRISADGIPQPPEDGARAITNGATVVVPDESAANDVLAALGPTFAELAASVLHELTDHRWRWRSAWRDSEGEVAGWLEPFRSALPAYLGPVADDHLPTVARLWGLVSGDGEAIAVVDQETLKMWGRRGSSITVLADEESLVRHASPIRTDG